MSEPLASQIRQEAEAQGVEVEKLIEAALRQYRFQSQREKISTESEWWRSVPSETRARYTGEYVAVHNQQVVDHDRDEETLRKRIRASYGKVAVLIAPAEGRRTLRIVSTRLPRS
ncbi:MAG TPA: DUF5678 domain-containing protein [Anaerolineae bacterium]|nr:DUF5678 domain-containing protein [Anaerolineae bacterium]